MCGLLWLVCYNFHTSFFACPSFRLSVSDVRFFLSHSPAIESRKRHAMLVISEPYKSVDPWWITCVDFGQRTVSRTAPVRVTDCTVARCKYYDVCVRVCVCVAGTMVAKTNNNSLVCLSVTFLSGACLHTRKPAWSGRLRHTYIQICTRSCTHSTRTQSDSTSATIWPDHRNSVWLCPRLGDVDKQEMYVE